MIKAIYFGFDTIGKGLDRALSNSKTLALFAFPLTVYDYQFHKQLENKAQQQLQPQHKHPSNQK
ncbi:MAG: hypothetical protein FWC92_00065 [Defluviitaleaceae bacterium]|nr:hypothetical protein [Defluviitaleaceae bacterium]